MQESREPGGREGARSGEKRSSRNKHRLNVRGSVYLAKEFGIYPAGVERLRTIPFCFVLLCKELLAEVPARVTAALLYWVVALSQLSGRHFTEAVSSLQGSDDVLMVWHRLHHQYVGGSFSLLFCP